MDYMESVKAVQRAMPKIDYANLIGGVAVLNRAINESGLKSQLELFDSANKWKEIIGLQSGSVLSEVLEQRGVMQALNLTGLNRLQEQSDFRQIISSPVYSILSEIDTANLAKALKISSPLADYDYGVMAKALQNSFAKKGDSVLDDKSETILNSFVEVVQEEYNRNEKVEDSNSEERKGTKKVSSDDVWRIIERIGIIVAIIASCKAIFGDTSSNNFISVYQTNNYYINELNVDADFWNIFQYRIINRNKVMPRIKPDCSSRVTGHLSEGCVVQMVNKHKKWVQIYWIDEDGNECCGWIQNYKLVKFKNSRLKGE